MLKGWEASRDVPRYPDEMLPIGPVAKKDVYRFVILRANIET